ncbi:MAG TPA: type II toxin-antitoxin system prevent-host-death family antitoxin [Microthrixaceae bacterium]|nr:type II toxin-antitoxin system prevent-host-death family antitoxin [Microthrixaceae bacterium]
MEAGVRELKARLSEFLGKVSEGEEVIVTDRGRPVARIVPFAGESAVARGIDEGWIDPPRRTRLGPAPRFRSHASILDVLDEDRG